MIKFFCQLVYFLFSPLVLTYSTFTFSIDFLSHSLCPFTFQTVKVELLYFLFRSIPKTFAHWMHPIVTFFPTTFSNSSHPRAIWWNISSRFKFNFAYSAMLIINITININPLACFTFGRTSSCKLSEIWYQSAILKLNC